MKTLNLALATKIAVASFILAAGTGTFAVGSANATQYGTNITIPDGITVTHYGGGTQTAVGSGTGGEDNEAEPYMVQSQAWDLEGFFLQGKALTIVGGYNFIRGQEGMKAGDIFIDVNGDAIRSPNINPNITSGYQELVNSFNYDFVLDVNWSAGTFDIVALNGTSLLKDTEYGTQYNQPSNPWIYLSGGSRVVASGLHMTTATVVGTGTDGILGDTGLKGWNGNNTHYAATFDISSINLDNGALFHNTMQCGNDNLMGEVGPAPVPEPGTMMLLGFGMLGLAVYGKRRMNKEA
jgi:hypothetical protein